MNAKEEIQKTLITEPIKLAIRPVLVSVGSILLLCIPVVYKWLASNLPFAILLTIAGSLTILLTATSAYLIYLLQKLKSLTTYNYQFGALWDSERNPHCPACFTYLSSDLFCLKCKIPVVLRNDAGAALSLVQAKVLLSGIIESKSGASAKSLPQQPTISEKQELDVLSTQILYWISRDQDHGAYHQFLYEDIQEDQIILNDHLNQLEKDGYIYEGQAEFGTGLLCTKKGISYLAEFLKSRRGNPTSIAPERAP